MLFETIVSSSASELSTRASMSVSGAPTRPNPPTMTVSPERMADTASTGSIGPFAIVTRRPFVEDPTRAYRACMQIQADDGLRIRYWTLHRALLYTCADVATRSPDCSSFVRGPPNNGGGSLGDIDRAGGRL